MSDLGNKEIIAKNIQHYMDLFGKDRKEICNDLNFRYSTFSEWVTGKKYPRIDKIEILANYFGIKKSDLVERHSDLPIPLLLDDDEKAIIADYRKLEPQRKKSVRDAIDLQLYQQETASTHSSNKNYENNSCS